MPGRVAQVFKDVGDRCGEGEPLAQIDRIDYELARTQAEMAALFADHPAVLENSVELAKRCNLELSLGKYYLPAFPVPSEHTIDSWLRRSAQASARGSADGRIKQRNRTRKAIVQAAMALLARGETPSVAAVAEVVRPPVAADDHK